MQSTSLFPQQGNITGKVTDKTLNEILPGATIVASINNTMKYAALSDINGTFNFKLDKGTYDISVSFIGFKNCIVKNIRIGDTIVNMNFELEESQQNLQMMEVKEYNAPLIQYDMAYSVSGIKGVKAESIHNVKRSSKRNAVTVSYIDDALELMDITNNNDIIIEEEEMSGKLTAGQLNDFGKWSLWKDITKTDLKNYQNIWKIYPLNRYSVQVESEKGIPVVDAIVILKDNKGNLIWSAHTDNTGKAELWSEMFNEKLSKEKIISTTYNGKEYSISTPVKFSEGLNMFKIPVSCEMPEMVDIAVVVDATTSMDDEIAYLKKELVDILNKTKNNYPDLKLNLGSVFYRCPDNSYITKKSDFSTTIDKTLDFINEQYSDEGGEEAVEVALDVAVNQMKWSASARARILFLVLDEPPTTDSSVVAKLKQVLIDAASKGIRIVPIVGSGEGYEKDRNMEYLMRSLALGTNGTYVFLTDHSQIGNAHTKPITDEYDVEILNDLLLRLIYEFTFVPDCNKSIDAKDMKDTMFVFNPKIIAHEVVDSSLLDKHGKSPEVKDTMLVVFNVDSSDIHANQDSIEEVVESADNTNEIINEDFRKFKYYPNPTSSVLNIEFDGEVKEIYLADISGKLLERFKIDNNMLQIDMSKYPVGIYFVQCFNNNKWLSGKIVKN
ncbi:MAG TPA: carboxypeptidase regulatory-like domain-containing protein [Bacteroidales bacterium]|nr:carboxypeptidase regulatory-like domain-containing protein [Bacteroidales bacterium]HPS17540.1 carboxypeptidase regulatory-like domain-containing protein [Bacteroidales bacterium]